MPSGVFDNRKRNMTGLIPSSKRSPEKLQELCSKGGKASGEAKRRNKTFKEAMAWALELPAMPTQDEEIERIREEYPDMTNRDAMAIAMAKATITEKNVRAFVAARDTTGELPAQTVNVQNAEPISITIKTID